MPHPISVSLRDAVKMILKFYGRRVTLHSIDSETHHISFVLYDAIAVKAHVDPHDSSLSVAIPLAAGVQVSSPLRRSTTFCEGESQIREALRVIDDYCRLRLPDEYLEAFESSFQIAERSLSNPAEMRAET